MNSPGNSAVATGNTVAVVQLSDGPITMDTDQSAAYKQGAGFNTDCLIRCYYKNRPQRWMMPIASPNGFQGDSVGFVQLAAPTTALHVEWTVAKKNDKPKIPDPTPKSGWVLLYQSPEPELIEIMANGVSAGYRCSGLYVYGCKKPKSQPVEDAQYPMPPWLEDVFPTQMSVQDFYQAFGSASAAGGASPGVPRIANIKGSQQQ